MENKNNMNAVLQAAPTPATPASIDQRLSDMREVYTNLDERLENGTYTAETLEQHADILGQLITEITNSYSANEETRTQLYDLVADIAETQNDYENLIIGLNTAANEMQGHLAGVNDLHISLVRVQMEDMLFDLLSIYNNEEQSISDLIERGDYTNETFDMHADILSYAMQELPIAYELNEKQTNQIEEISATLLETQTALENGSISLEEAAKKLNEQTKAVNKISSKLTSSINIDFKPMNFVHNLKYMGQGMLIIMLVMCVLIAGTALLNKATAAIAEAREKKANGTANETKED